MKLVFTSAMADMPAANTGSIRSDTSAAIRALPTLKADTFSVDAGGAAH